jgi:hypothetical protein
MASNYHFCFSFSRIILDGPTIARVGVFSAFKMALLLGTPRIIQRSSSSEPQLKCFARPVPAERLRWSRS